MKILVLRSQGLDRDTESGVERTKGGPHQILTRTTHTDTAHVARPFLPALHCTALLDDGVLDNNRFIYDLSTAASRAGERS